MSAITLTPEELANLVAKAVAEGVAQALASGQQRTPRQERNRRYYENNRRLKTSESVASESVLKASDGVLNGLNTSEIKTPDNQSPPSPPSLSPAPPIPPAPAPALPARTRKPPKPKPLPDELWLLALEADKTYAGIDIRLQLGKMQRWCEENGGQIPSRRRFINWLNRSDRTISTNGTKPNANATSKPIHRSGATGLANQPGRYGTGPPKWIPPEPPEPSVVGAGTAHP